jgi:BlaI family penicillinase repressor
LAKRPSRPPTAAETAILACLWNSGPSTVGEVRDRLGNARTGYTTVLKLLQVMHEKGLVRRDESSRAHRYEAAVRREQAQSTALASMVRQLFAGSVSQLVLRALADAEPTAEEIAEIRRLLRDRADR